MKNLIRKISRFTCKDVSSLSAKALDGKLTLSEKFWAHIHLSICPPCVRFMKQLKYIRKVNQQENAQTPPPESYQLSEESRDRIRQKLEKQK